MSQSQDYLAYRRSLPAGDQPLHISRWREKHKLLASLLQQDPHGQRRDLDARIKQLCEELGV